jgi:hypothetical protein
MQPRRLAVLVLPAGALALPFLLWGLPDLAFAAVNAIAIPGRAIRAMRDHPIAAQAAGIDAARYTALRFGVGAASCPMASPGWCRRGGGWRRELRGRGFDHFLCVAVIHAVRRYHPAAQCPSCHVHAPPPWA